MEANNLPVPLGGSPAVPVAQGETSSSAIAAREKAAVEARYLVALHRPRNFDQGRLRLLDACKRPKFADAARYSKPVGRDRVNGFSIRFAEEARVLWGNMDVSTFLVLDDDSRRVYRVIGTDLETNATEGIDVMVEKFVERRVVREGMEVIGQRTNTTGQVVYKIRATEDDLFVKVNALLSKARRNVILSLIPADVKEECEEQCLDTMRDHDAKDPAAARKAIVDAFWGFGVTPQQISDVLGKPLEQINPAEITMLRTYYRAMKEGEATWTEIAEAHTGGKKSENGKAEAASNGKGTDALKQALGKKAKGADKPGAQSGAQESAVSEAKPAAPATPAPAAAVATAHAASEEDELWAQEEARQQAEDTSA